jgi:hypothetical protein
MVGKKKPLPTLQKNNIHKEKVTTLKTLHFLYKGQHFKIKVLSEKIFGISTKGL